MKQSELVMMENMLVRECERIMGGGAQRRGVLGLAVLLGSGCGAWKCLSGVSTVYDDCGNRVVERRCSLSSVAEKAPERSVREWLYSRKFYGEDDTVVGMYVFYPTGGLMTESNYAPGGRLMEQHSYRLDGSALAEIYYDERGAVLRGCIYGENGAVAAAVQNAAA